MKDFIFGTAVHDKTASIGLLIFRVAIGLFIAFGHGIDKIPVNDQFVGMVSGMGIPAAALFAWLAAIVEFFGALLVVLGLETRTAAMFLTIHFAAAAFIFHASDPFKVKELAFVYFFSSLMLCFTGGGKYAIDRKIHS